MSHLPFSAFNQINMEVLPDSYYMTCGDDRRCDICSNYLWSPVVNGYVHDTQRGKVFCPFGKDDSMDLNIYNDQNSTSFPITKWGMAPQMDPRSLSKIGLSWRTS